MKHKIRVKLPVERGLAPFNQTLHFSIITLTFHLFHDGAERNARLYDRNFGGSSSHLPGISVRTLQIFLKKSEIRSLFCFAMPSRFQKPSYQRQR